MWSWAESATTKDLLAVRQEGKRQVRRRLKHYNLDAIISVGYRVNSSRATRFRQWATRVLRAQGISYGDSSRGSSIYCFEKWSPSDNLIRKLPLRVTFPANIGRHVSQYNRRAAAL